MTVHRMWYVSTGTMSQNRAIEYIDRIKKEIEEKYKDDSKYEDYVFATTGEPRMEIIETS